MPILYPTERGKTELAVSRVKDALRMLEKKMPTDTITRATKVNTGGPSNWEHIIPTEFPRHTLPPTGISEVPLGLLDRADELKRIAPEVYNTPVIFNDASNFSDKNADGRYNSADNVIGIPGASARSYILNHEGTHAGYLSPTGDPALDRYLIADTNQKDAGIPYSYRKEEIRAKIAENLTDSKNMEDTIAALNSMYKVRKNVKGIASSSSMPSDTFAVDMRMNSAGAGQ